jgi:hypothetical protein
MTPELLEKIASLIEKGATVIGTPPLKSPGLTDYPDCDSKVKKLAKELWGSLQIPENISERKYGEGRIYWGGNLISEDLYPSYKSTTELLSGMNIQADFKSGNNTIRFGHRKTAEKDIFFIANRTRAEGEPELWIGTKGESRKISDYKTENGITTIPLEFFPYESFFVTFSGSTGEKASVGKGEGEGNFPILKPIKTIEGAWSVSFDSKMGGPEEIKFETLVDWTDHEMRGIKYYSGIAKYSKSFNVSEINTKGAKLYLDLGVVNDIARVKLNGKDLGVVWCAPWRIEISGALKEGENNLEIEVANRWVNRLLGDKQAPDANVRTVKFENGLMGGREFKTGRYTFTTRSAMGSFKFKEPLSSGLLGPVTIVK